MRCCRKSVIFLVFAVTKPSEMQEKAVKERNIRLSIVLPCYNEAENLPMLLERYREVWRDLPAELILVNNGSTDTTAEVLERELARPEMSFARTVLVPENIGYGHGIHTGVLAAEGEYIAFSHADMQCSPKDVFRAFRALITTGEPKGCIIKGRRAPRDFGAEVVTRTMGLLASVVLRMYLRDINAQPKVFHRSLLDHMADAPTGFQYDLYVLYTAKKNGRKLMTIPVEFGERAHGQSKWAFNVIARYKTIWSIVEYIFRLGFGKV